MRRNLEEAQSVRIIAINGEVYIESETVHYEVANDKRQTLILSLLRSIEYE